MEGALILVGIVTVFACLLAWSALRAERKERKSRDRAA
jgi:hypothetical protein